LNIHKRQAAEDSVNQAWLEKVVREMLADADPPVNHQPAVHFAVEENQPARHQRRAQQPTRDGYGRPLRPTSVPAPQACGQDARPATPRTGHPLGVGGKLLLGAVFTSLGMGITTGLASAEPLPGDYAPSTPDSRPAAPTDVRGMSDRQLGQELARVSGKDSLRTQEVVSEMKLRGTQLFEATPDNGSGSFSGNLYGTTAPAAAPVAGDTGQTRPALKVVVIGDSFTSGEGATSSTYRTVPVTRTTEDGIQYQSLEVDPAHQSSTAPSLQALNQIQAANPGVDIQVSFVPVSGATRDMLYQTTRPGTEFEQAPQINAVKGADVVIVGIGGNDARFSDWVKTALSSTDSTSAQQFPQFMQQLNDGTYLANQTRLLNDVSNLASPNATIVSLGYPMAMPATVPGTPTWWSPFSWTTISQGEADRSNQLATALNSNNQTASMVTGLERPGQQFVYADVSTALQGHELFTNREGLNGLTPSNIPGSYHPNDLGQQLLGSVMQPYVEQAVNNQLSRLGIQGAENVPPINPTFSYQWNLRVDVPMQEQARQQALQPPTDPAQQPPSEQPATQPPAEQPPAEQPPAEQPPAEQPPAEQPPAQPDTPQQETPQQETPPDAQPVAPQADAPQPAETPAAPAETPAAPADTPAAPADAAGAPAETPAEPAQANPAPAETPAPAEQAPAPAEQAPAPAEQAPAPAAEVAPEPAPTEITPEASQPITPINPAATDVNGGLGSNGLATDPGFGSNTGLGTDPGLGSNTGLGTDSGLGSNTGLGTDTGSFNSGGSSLDTGGSFNTGGSSLDTGGSFDTGGGSLDTGGSFDTGGGSFDSGGGSFSGGGDSGGGF